MSVVSFALELDGDVSSFTPSVQDQMQSAIAAQAGVGPSAVELAISPGSVIVDVSIQTPTATAASVQSAMASATSGPSNATAMLTNVTGVSIVVLAIVTPLTITDASPPPPPSPAPPAPLSPESAGASAVETSGLPPLSPSPSDPTGTIIGVVVGVIIALALALAILHRRRRDMHPKEAQKPPAWWNPQKPVFYFLPRATVLGASSKQLGRMQELRDSLQLVKLAIDLNEAFQGKGLIENILFVSHRWEASSTPDETGAQLEALQAHLMAHPEIQYVWFDYSCMPQRSESAHLSGTDDRTPAEKAEFILMLKAITDMYLTAKVLILLDTMYRTRFWTTMEGWCAMQKVTPQGVRPAEEGEARHTVSCIHNATMKDREALLEMSTKTQAEILIFLASPDVMVTNQKDKTTMLPIVGKTDERVREMMSGSHSC
jgi:hypothetical protein